MAIRKLVYALSVLVCITAIPYVLQRLRRKGETIPAPLLSIRVFLIVLAVPALAFLAGASQIDDSYIYDRYIRNALAGQGLVYNFGEHVNALSSPIFGYLLLFVSWIVRGNVLLASELLSAACLLGASLLAESLVPFAGLLVAGTAYFYALTGMETTLFSLMLLLTLTLYVKGRYNWLPVVSVLVVLTRFEGAVLVLVIGVAMVRRRHLPRLIYFLPALLLLAAYLGLNKRFYGVYLPSSAIAKLGQGFSGYWGKWPRAFLGIAAVGWLHTLFEGVIFATPIMLGLALNGLLNKRKSPLTEIVVPFCAILFLIYTATNMPGDYFWYLSPFVLFALLYMAAGIPQTPWALALTIVFVLINFVQTGRLIHQFRPKGYYGDYVEAGAWFQRHTPPTATVGAVEIGLLGWSSHRYIYDAIGLTTPRNAVFVAHHNSDAWIADDRPDYVLVHASPWYWETAVRHNPDYAVVSVHLSAGSLILRRRDYKGDDPNAPSPR